MRGPRLVRDAPPAATVVPSRDTASANTSNASGLCCGPTPASGRWGGSRRARGRARRDPSRPHRLRRQTSAAPHAPVAVSGAAPATGFARPTDIWDSTADVSGVFRARCRRRAGPHRWRARVWRRCTTRELASSALSNVPPRPHRVADPRPRGARPPAASPFSRATTTRAMSVDSSARADGPEPGRTPSFPRALRAPERRWRRVRVRAAGRPGDPSALFKHEVAFALGQMQATGAVEALKAMAPMGRAWCVTRLRRRWAPSRATRA